MQTEMIKNLEAPATENAFQSWEALAQYTKVNCRPDIYGAVQLLAQESSKMGEAQFKSMGKAASELRYTTEIGLNVLKLDISSVRVAVLSDAPFANTVGAKRQLEFMIPMTD